MTFEELHEQQFLENHEEFINEDGEKEYRQIDHIYYIYEGNMEKLEKKLLTIQNKCKKYNCDFVYDKLGEVMVEFEMETKDGKKDIGVSKFFKIRVFGNAVQNDWEFVASIERSPSDKVSGNMVKGIRNDIEIPIQYYTAPIMCEHCGNKRTSKSLLVHNTKTNQFMQVGRNCLKDFTFGMSAEGIAQLLNGLNEVVKGEAPMAGGRIIRWRETRLFLLYVAECIKKFGWVSKSNSTRLDESTSSRAEKYMLVESGNHPWWMSPKDIEMCRDEMASVNFKADSDTNTKLVNDALEWVRGLSEDERYSNSYLNNLYLSCADDYFHENEGFIASLIQAYEKHLGEEVKKSVKLEAMRKERETSQYVGNIKDRLDVKIKSIKVLATWETGYGYPPTTMRLLKLVDVDGNVFTWTTSGFIDVDEIEKRISEHGFIPIKGTVKEYKEYEGTKQTVLTRCKLL